MSKIDTGVYVVLWGGNKITLDKKGLALLSRSSWSLDKDGYLRAKVLGSISYFHREIIEAASGTEVDHINRDRLDNRVSNLRICTRSANVQNSSKRTGSSKYLGVSPNKNNWRAQITKDGEKFYLGTFKTELEAALIYDKKATELYGDCAHVNFPPSDGGL